MSIKKIRVTLGGIALISGLMLSPVQAAPAPAGAYNIDPAHTNLGFAVSHLGFSHVIGRFNQVAGQVTIDPKGQSSANVTIQTASVDTNHAKRNTDLRGPDFFNAKQFPTLTFAATSAKFNTAGEVSSLSGNLTAHGVTKPVTMTVKQYGAGKDPWGGFRVGYFAETTIKRSDFGMNFMKGALGDDVALRLDIELVKKK